MAKKFKNIEELKHYLENSVNAVLDTSVKDIVVDTLIEHAEVDVYGVYPFPKKYDRRMSLKKEENYEVDKSQNMKLKITPVARFNPSTLRYDKRTRTYVPSISINGNGDELAGLINYGDDWNGYSYEFVSDEEAENPTYSAPRPFIDNTKEELKDGGFKNLLTFGLEEYGIKVKQ